MLKELREKRAKAVADARAILDEQDKSGAELSAEKREQFDKYMEDAKTLKSQIDAREALDEAERDLTEPQERRSAPNPIEGRDGDDKRDDGKGDPEKRDAENSNPRATKEYRAAFDSWLRYGPTGLSDSEKRALSQGKPTEGGYLSPSEQFVLQLIQSVDNAVFMRGLATMFQVTSADSLGAPSLDTDVSDPTWTAEIATGSEDSSMAFGKRELKPNPLAIRIKVSNKLLRTSAMNPEGLVRERLAYKFGVVAENAYLNGSGANQPLGVFVASSDGISTGRDVSTGNTATSITFDGLKEAKYTLKGAYHPNSRWIFHRDGVKQIAKLKDGNGQYIWTPSVIDGEPDRVLGRPVIMSEYAPNTFTTGLYVGIFGDFSNYWIADALTLQVQRLIELYAEANQTGFIGRLETDGAPVLEEAFVRVKLG